MQTNLGVNGNNHYGSGSDLSSLGPRPMVIAPRPACSPFGGHPGFGAAPAAGAAGAAGASGATAARNTSIHRHHHHNQPQMSTSPDTSESSSIAAKPVNALTNLAHQPSMAPPSTVTPLMAGNNSSEENAAAAKSRPQWPEPRRIRRSILDKL